MFTSFLPWSDFCNSDRTEEHQALLQSSLQSDQVAQRSTEIQWRRLLQDQRAVWTVPWTERNSRSPSTSRSHQYSCLKNAINQFTQMWNSVCHEVRKILLSLSIIKNLHSTMYAISNSSALCKSVSFHNDTLCISDQISPTSQHHKSLWFNYILTSLTLLISSSSWFSAID